MKACHGCFKYMGNASKSCPHCGRLTAPPDRTERNEDQPTIDAENIIKMGGKPFARGSHGL